MNPIAVGTISPPIVLPDEYGNTFNLADARGKANVLILFLPRCFTPICSTEVPALEAMLDRFLTETNTWPVAVTVDGTDPNLAWVRSMGVSRLRLLSDCNPPGAVSRSYGVLAPDYVSERSTFIVDKNGIVRYGVVAGRYGKRSISGLLSIASQINGGQPITSPAAGLQTLDLPVLYVMDGCQHCAAVKAFLSTSGLSRKIVVKNVSDQAVMRELLQVSSDGGVPLLRMPDGRTFEGDKPIIQALGAQYKVAA